MSPLVTAPTPRPNRCSTLSPSLGRWCWRRSPRASRWARCPASASSPGSPSPSRGSRSTTSAKVEPKSSASQRGTGLRGGAVWADLFSVFGVHTRAAFVSFIYETFFRSRRVAVSCFFFIVAPCPALAPRCGARVGRADCNVFRVSSPLLSIDFKKHWQSFLMANFFGPELNYGKLSNLPI